MVLNIDDGDGPLVSCFITVEWNFQCISTCDWVLFVHVCEGESDAWFSVLYPDLEVNAEIFLRDC